MSPVEYAGGKRSLWAYIAVCLQIHCNPSSCVYVKLASPPPHAASWREVCKYVSSLFPSEFNFRDAPRSRSQWLLSFSVLRMSLADTYVVHFMWLWLQKPLLLCRMSPWEFLCAVSVIQYVWRQSGWWRRYTRLMKVLYHVYSGQRVGACRGRRASVKMGLGRAATCPTWPLIYPLGQHPAFRTVVVPEAAQHLSGSDITHVQPDHPDDEQAVASKVVLGEFGEHGRRPLSSVEGAQPPSDVLDLPGPVERPKQPNEQVTDGDDGHEHQPEPEEDEDLLVEEVDGQRALDDVLVNTTARVFGTYWWTRDW